MTEGWDTGVKEPWASRPTPGHELTGPPPCTTLGAPFTSWVIRMTFPGVAWLYTAAMDIFRVTNIPNIGGKRDYLLFSCPETGSQRFSLWIMALSDPSTMSPCSGGHQAAQAVLAPNTSSGRRMEGTQAQCSSWGKLWGDKMANELCIQLQRQQAGILRHESTWRI